MSQYQTTGFINQPAYAQPAYAQQQTAQQPQYQQQQQRMSFADMNTLAI